MISNSESPFRLFAGIASSAWKEMPGSAATDPLSARVALWITLTTVFVVLVLALFILILHQYNGMVQRRSKRWSDRWLLQLLDPENHGPIPKLRPSQLVAYQTLWNHVHQSMRGDIRRSLVSISRNTGAIGLSLHRLRHGSTREKILSATFLGNHVETAAIEPLSLLVSEQEPFLSLSCARALLQIDATGQLPVLLDALLRREDWPLPVVNDILSDVDPELLSAHLPSAFLRWQPEPTPRALSLLALVHDDVCISIVDILQRRAAELSPETLAAMLLQIRSPVHLPMVRAGLDSPHPFVATAALEVIGRMGSRQDIPRLTELLGDRDWWVRYRASRALVQLPGVKAIEIELIATRHSDRYGREMLRYALAERNLR